MHASPHEIEADPVAHLPSVNADADKLDLVGLINYGVPTEMDVDAGTIVLGLCLQPRHQRVQRLLFLVLRCPRQRRIALRRQRHR